MTERAGWFGAGDRSLFGWFCSPDGGRADGAVLLCPPIGEEEHNAHETFRRLAASLAAAGMASLRFDYHGTGDSLGHWSDPARGDAWLTSVVDAYQALRGSGVEHVAVVGMRIGATLAATASQRGLIDPTAMVLWDPCSGKSMLREGQARSPGRLPAPPGAVDTPGYLYGADTADDLRSLDPAALAVGPLAPEVYVLVRDDRPTARGLRDALDGPGVEWSVAKGQSELLDLPMTENVVPAESVADVVSWLRSCTPHAGTAVSLDLQPELTFRESSDQCEVTERVVSLGDLGLFGITTEPDGPSRGPLLVLINVANDRHVGPGRRWVDGAREWARMGFRVLRMDQSGTGDSPSHDDQEFGTLYAAEWLDDLPLALASPTCAESDLAIISLCSGAYSAMETAFQLPVAQLYAINVILHAKATSKASPLRDDRRVAARPPIAPLLRLSRRYPRLASLLWSAYRQVTVWNAPMASVADLVDRGTRVVLIMSHNDGRHFNETLYWTALRVPKMRRAGKYRLVINGDIDHTLMTQEGQRCVMNAITSDLLAQHPTEPDRPSMPSVPLNATAPSPLVDEPAIPARRNRAPSKAQS